MCRSRRAARARKTELSTSPPLTHLGVSSTYVPKPCAATERCRKPSARVLSSCGLRRTRRRRVKIFRIFQKVLRHLRFRLSGRGTFLRVNGVSRLSRAAPLCISRCAIKSAPFAVAGLSDFGCTCFGCTCCRRVRQQRWRATHISRAV